MLFFSLKALNVSILSNNDVRLFIDQSLINIEKHNIHEQVMLLFFHVTKLYI